jgi:hypothetical protein
MTMSLKPNTPLWRKAVGKYENPSLPYSLRGRFKIISQCFQWYRWFDLIHNVKQIWISKPKLFSPACDLRCQSAGR